MAGWVSNRPPGVWAAAVPVYALSETDSAAFFVWPATLTAVLTSAGVLVGLHRVLLRVTEPRAASIAVILFGLGTSTWSISSDQLWPHSTVQLWLLVGLLLSARNHTSMWAGLGYGLAILARPVTAVIPVTDALLRASRRHYGSAAAVLAGALPGAAALIVYNGRVFGSFGVSGGYSSTFVDRLSSLDLATWFIEVSKLLLSPVNGVLLWCPMLLVLIPGVLKAYRIAPDWVRTAAMSAIAYLLLHTLLNRASGGVPFGYRYPLGPLALLAPLLMLAYQTWVRERKLRLLLFGISAAMSIAAQFALVFTLECTPTPTGQFGCSIF